MKNKQRKIACETSRSGWKRSQTNSKIHKCQHSQTLLKIQFRTVVLNWYRGSTLLKPTFPKTEIAKSACEPKWQGLLAEDVLVQSCPKRKILVIWWPQITKFFVMDVNHHRYAVVVQDLTTQWLQSCPCKTKVIYTDISLEFGKACEEFSWNHCTSTHHRSETKWDCWESGTQNSGMDVCCILSQSDLDEKWWADSMECYCYLRNVEDLLADENTP